jgi:hypothetical protein
MIAVDRHQADVTDDLVTAPGRWRAIAAVTRLAGGRLDGLVHVPTLEERRQGRGARIVSASDFGRIEILKGVARAGRERGPRALPLRDRPRRRPDRVPARARGAGLLGGDPRR